MNIVEVLILVVVDQDLHDYRVALGEGSDLAYRLIINWFIQTGGDAPDHIHPLPFCHPAQLDTLPTERRIFLAGQDDAASNLFH